MFYMDIAEELSKLVEEINSNLILLPETHFKMSILALYYS